MQYIPLRKVVKPGKTVNLAAFAMAAASQLSYIYRRVELRP
jgi:hypothetical protein